MNNERDLALHAAVRAAVRERLSVLTLRYKGVAGGAAALLALVAVAPSVAPTVASFTPLGSAFGGANYGSAPTPSEAGRPRTDAAGTPAGAAPPMVPALPVVGPAGTAIAPEQPSATATTQSRSSTDCPTPAPSATTSPGALPADLPALPTPEPPPLPLPSSSALPEASPSPTTTPPAGCVRSSQAVGDVAAVPGWTRILRWLRTQIASAR